MEFSEEKKLAEARAQVMKALAHPTRIFMVELLSKGNLSVRSLTEAVGSDVSTVSKHLSLLKQSGILESRKKGNKVLYNLKCPCILNFIRCIDDVIYKDAEKGLNSVMPQKSMIQGERRCSTNCTEC